MTRAAPGAAFETVEIMVRGIGMRVWKDVPATAAEAFARARTHGDREFLVYGAERVTYDSFARASLRVAALLATPEDALRELKSLLQGAAGTVGAAQYRREREAQGRLLHGLARRAAR